MVAPGLFDREPQRRKDGRPARGAAACITSLCIYFNAFRYNDYCSKRTFMPARRGRRLTAH
jgi:hypothetical protein